jgi:cyclophilin family peptidyl-prolyl cis-trans isomerase
MMGASGCFRVLQGASGCGEVRGCCKVLSKVSVVLVAAVLALWPVTAQKSPGAGPVIVLETERGVIEFETYPDEAPKTVARVVELVKKGFYNGHRFHRAEPNFLIQVGDPQSRNVAMQEWWGRTGSGKPIGVAEISKKRRHLRGAVAMAYPGSDPRAADSQFYILLAAKPEFDGKYTVFGKVINGLPVVDKIRRSDILRKASVRE